MLESVAAGIVVGVAPKVRQDEHGGVAGIFRFALNRLPQFRAEAVGAADAVDVERVRSGVRDVDIVHGDPEQAGRDLPHQVARDVDGKLVGAG